MKHTIIDKAALKAESERQQIPFAKLLAGYVLETFMYLVTDCAFAKHLWLKNTGIFGVDSYRRENNLTLEFAYLTSPRVMKTAELLPGQRLSLKMGYVMLAAILQKEKTPEIHWMGRAEEKQGGVVLEVAGTFEEMTVPLHIRITEMGKTELIPALKQQSLLMEKNKTMEYLQYPAEIILAEQLFSILEKMELIPDMQSYACVYEILKNEAVDGRHVREMLWKFCKAAHFSLESDRAEDILSYKNYTYMRKRWEKYLRRRKQKEPSWEAVMEVLEAFLPRVWASICEDEVMIGDWMPDLRRFLD